MSLQHQIKQNGIAAQAIAARNANDGLPLIAIRTDGGTQSRAELQQHVVEEYALAIENGASFPAVIVFYDGTDHWLADGFHRFHAYRAAGMDRLPAEVRQGTRRDAILYSVGANETHGLRRSNDDKRRAVLTLLNDPEWTKWSDREIARQCNVSNRYVSNLRPVTVNVHSEERTYTTKHGTTATMKTAAIGKPAALNKEDQDAVEATAASGADRAATRKTNGPSMFIPEGQDIVALCRRGLKLEAEGMTIEKAAAELNLATTGYRISRQIVLLADMPELSASCKAIAKEALDILLTTRQWTAAWEIAEPLAIRVWGAGSRFDLPNIAAKRLDQFELSFGIVMQACLTTNEIDLPYLSAERVKKALREIGAARGALSRFADKIKEIHE